MSSSILLKGYDIQANLIADGRKRLRNRTAVLSRAAVIWVGWIGGLLLAQTGRPPFPKDPAVRPAEGDIRCTCEIK